MMMCTHLGIYIFVCVSPPMLMQASMVCAHGCLKYGMCICMSQVWYVHMYVSSMVCAYVCLCTRAWCTYVRVYVYMYVCVCVCVCVCAHAH
jgi:hypothetical protein